MNFVTLSFAFFFVFVLAMHAILRKGTLPYAYALLAINAVFYASAGLSFVPLLCFVGLLNWAVAQAMERYKARASLCKAFLSINVTIHVALLVFYKYYEFVLVHLEMLFSHMGLHLSLHEVIATTEFLYPVGLSFYIFQGLSYAIDQYRHKTPPQSFLHVLLFVSFFPTILAGPILRAKDFFPQLLGQKVPESPLVQEHFLPQNISKLEEKRQDILIGFSFILSGLFKKVVLASYLSEHIVRDVFLTPEAYASMTVLMAVYAYAMQIYCDFSGYSDMAVGVARLMGYRLPQNFNAPYLALSIQDFWRRWHISLSTWLRDYLYIPLGGNKRGNKMLNLILTMTIGGLWHGSHLRFLIWGMMHGVLLSFVHLWQDACKGAARRLCTQSSSGQTSSAQTSSGQSSFGPTLWGARAYGLLGWFLTFHFVCLLWVFFRADSTDQALLVLERVAFWENTGEGFALLVPVAIAVTMLLQWWGSGIFKAFVAVMASQWLLVQVFVFSLLCACILKLGPDGVLPFIYFQF